MSKQIGHLTQTGFVMGPMTVNRLFHDAKLGSWIEVSGKRETVQIRVTKGGRLRIGKATKSTT